MTTWTETSNAESEEYVEDDYVEPDYVESDGWATELPVSTPTWVTS